MNQTQKQTPDKKEVRKGCLILIVILVIIILIIFGVKKCYSDNNNENSQEKQKELFKATKQDAVVHSHLCIEKYLKSPGSADFPHQSDDSIDQINDSTFVVLSYVDSQNTYGALVRTYYKMTVVFDVNGNAKCEDMKLEEQK